MNGFEHPGAKLVHFFGVQGGIGGYGLVDLFQGHSHRLLLRFRHGAIRHQRREGFRGFRIIPGLETGIDGRNGLLNLGIGGPERFLERLCRVGASLSPAPGRAKSQGSPKQSK